MYGWMGTILKVDLSSCVIEKEPLSEELRLNFIGGRGINGRILYNEVKPEVDGLDPANRLIFGTGPLTGTMLPSGRLNLTTKSPITGILGDSNAGSHFAPELKYAGYDHIVFTGRADKPVYLWIDDDKVELRDAQHLWGKGTDVTRRMIEGDVGDSRIQVASIGPAGENLVESAGVVIGSDGFCAHCGVGAVMGSKHLKAIALRGTKGVKVAQPDVFRALSLDLLQRTMRSPNYPAISTYGTTRLFPRTQTEGTMAIRNATQPGPFAGYDEISPETLYQKYVLKSKACFGCAQHCRNWFEIKEGPYAGLKGVGIEFSVQQTWGALCGNSYAPSLYKAMMLCNEYGLDLSTVAHSVAALMEWYEKGIITKGDLGGVELQWGNYEGMIEMIHKIANREGIGELLAKGPLRAAQELGREAEKCLTHCKGVVRTTPDIRSLTPFQLGFAVSTRGPDHLRGIIPYPPDRVGSYEGIAKGVYDMQGLCTIADSLEVCKLNTPYSRMELTLKDMASFLLAATGIKVSEQGLREIADRIYTLERAFIVREGITRKDDDFIGRLRDDPEVHWGPLRGFKHDPEKWDRMLDEYYGLAGWDKETGVPAQAKLEALGLRDVAEELGRMLKPES